MSSCLSIIGRLCTRLMASNAARLSLAMVLWLIGASIGMKSRFAQGQTTSDILPYQETYDDVLALKKKAESLLKRRDIRGGRAYWRAALELSSRYRASRRWAVHRLTNTDIEFGQAQLAKLYSDRPSLKQFKGRRGFKEVESEIVAMFAGKYSGYRIKWGGSPRDPKSLSNCFRITNSRGVEGVINVALVTVVREEVKPLETGEMTWESVVFELFNVSALDETQPLADAIPSGAVTKDEYVSAMFASELRTVGDVQRFYASTWLPFVEQSATETHPELWYSRDLYWMADDKSALNIIPRTAWYPWKVYYQSYDRIAGLRGIEQENGNQSRD